MCTCTIRRSSYTEFVSRPSRGVGIRPAGTSQPVPKCSNRPAIDLPPSANTRTERASATNSAAHPSETLGDVCAPVPPRVRTRPLGVRVRDTEPSQLRMQRTILID